MLINQSSAILIRCCLAAGLMIGVGQGCGKKPVATKPGATNKVAGAQSKTNVVSDPATNAAMTGVVQRAEFTLTGKDPFFPKTERLAKKEEEPVIQKPKGVAATNIVVRTISIVGGKPKAFINTKDFQEGQEAEIGLPDGKRVRVKCIAIKEVERKDGFVHYSVIVDIANVGRRELSYRKRIW